MLVSNGESRGLEDSEDDTAKERNAAASTSGKSNDDARPNHFLRNHTLDTPRAESSSMPLRHTSTCAI